MSPYGDGEFLFQSIAVGVTMVVGEFRILGSDKTEVEWIHVCEIDCFCAHPR
jgi:hypothetical protein